MYKRIGTGKLEVENDELISVANAHIRGAIDTKNFSYIEVKSAFLEVSASSVSLISPPVGTIIMGDTNDHRYKLTGDFNNDPETDSYNAKGIGDDWVDLEMANQPEQGVPVWMAGLADPLTRDDDGNYYTKVSSGDSAGNDPVGNDGSDWLGPFTHAQATNQFAKENFRGGRNQVGV